MHTAKTDSGTTTHRSQGFRKTGRRIPDNKDKNNWIDIKNILGSTSSKWPISLENRFMILPTGFESKNRTGACKTASAILL